MARPYRTSMVLSDEIIARVDSLLERERRCSVELLKLADLPVGVEIKVPDQSRSDMLRRLIEYALEQGERQTERLEALIRERQQP